MTSDEGFSSCPIWNTAAEWQDRRSDKALISSSRAGGEFWITGSALAMVMGESLPGWKRVALSQLVFDACRAQVIPCIDSSTLNDLKYPRQLNTTEKIDRFLSALCDTFPKLGDEIQIRNVITSEDGAYLAAAVNAAGSAPQEYAQELAYLFEALEERSFLKIRNPETFARLTMDGWSKYESLGFSLNQSDQIFVAMWFGSEEQSFIYNHAIRPAIEAAGYVSVRIDNTEHNEKIDDQIIAEIRKSKAVVVDLTCGLASPIGGWSSRERVGAPRGGVFYEAGFAKGLGLPVIWTVKQEVSEVENVVHFDVRQYNQIRWTPDMIDFRERLQMRIEATIGKGRVTSKLAQA